MRLHHQRRRADAVAEEADALHQRALGDAGGREDDVLARREILRPVDPLEVGDAHRAAALLVLRRVDDEPREDLAAEAAHGRRREHALGRAADAHHGVHAAADRPPRRCRPTDRRRRSGGCARRWSRISSISVLVTRTIEHDDDEVLDAAAERLRDRAQVEAHRRVEIDDVARARPDDELLHVDVGRVQQAAVLGRRQHGQRIGRTGRAQVGALERIDGDVDLRILAPVVVLGRPCRPSRRCRASAPRRARPRRSRSCRRSARSPSRGASLRRPPGPTCGGRPVPSCARRRSPPAPRRAGSRARDRNRAGEPFTASRAVWALASRSWSLCTLVGRQLAPRRPVVPVAEQVVGLHDLVDFARALVDHGTLAVAIEAAHRVFVRVAVGAVDLDRVGRRRARTRRSRTTWPARSRACCGGLRSSAIRNAATAAATPDSPTPSARSSLSRAGTSRSRGRTSSARARTSRWHRGTPGSARSRRPQP